LEPGFIGLPAARRGFARLRSEWRRWWDRGLPRRQQRRQHRRRHLEGLEHALGWLVEAFGRALGPVERWAVALEPAGVAVDALAGIELARRQPFTAELGLRLLALDLPRQQRVDARVRAGRLLAGRRPLAERRHRGLEQLRAERAVWFGELGPVGRRAERKLVPALELAQLVLAFE
jgi:hypothetical protein